MNIVGKGYIKKNKSLQMGKGPGGSHYRTPLWTGPINIEGKTYYIDIHPVNGKWGKQDVYMQVKKNPPKEKSLSLRNTNNEDLIL